MCRPFYTRWFVRWWCLVKTGRLETGAGGYSLVNGNWWIWLAHIAIKWRTVKSRLQLDDKDVEKRWWTMMIAKQWPFRLHDQNIWIEKQKETLRIRQVKTRSESKLHIISVSWRWELTTAFTWHELSTRGMEGVVKELWTSWQYSKRKERWRVVNYLET